MASYAAALRVLTRYSVIDGRDMTAEASRPRVKGETTFVDGLIAFAVNTANQCLVPEGISKGHWDKLGGAERFYLKMLDLEARGTKTLDNYQNFAKAFEVRDFKPLLASQKANDARLKSAVEFGRGEMSEGSELYQSVLRAVLYAMMELVAIWMATMSAHTLPSTSQTTTRAKPNADWSSNSQTTSPRNSKPFVPTKPAPRECYVSW